VAVSPTGQIWVTDRRLRGVYVFSHDGAFIREFAAPEKVRKIWSPIWVSFDSKGNVYVCDVGKSEGHRVLVFDQTGALKHQWGKTAQIQHATESPGNFYYPNAVAVDKNNDIFVTDSNNHRVQVFDSAGAFKRFISSPGTRIALQSMPSSGCTSSMRSPTRSTSTALMASG
jgi:hypothetical protein